jgi:hypothetical protein
MSFTTLPKVWILDEMTAHMKNLQGKTFEMVGIKYSKVKYRGYLLLLLGGCWGWVLADRHGTNPRGSGNHSLRHRLFRVFGFGACCTMAGGSGEHLPLHRFVRFRGHLNGCVVGTLEP